MERYSIDRIYYIPHLVEEIVYFLSILQVLMSGLVILFYLLSTSGLTVKIRWHEWERQTRQRVCRTGIHRLNYILQSTVFVMQDEKIRYYIFYAAISIAGFYVSPHFLCFQLLDVATRNPTLQNLTMAITRNKMQILLTAMLGLFVVYIYTVIAFFYLQDTLHEYGINKWDSDFPGETMCRDML